MPSIYDRNNLFCNRMWRHLKSREKSQDQATIDTVNARYSVCDGDPTCEHWDGAGCGEYGCMNNETVAASFYNIMLDPARHCPIFGEMKW